MENLILPTGVSKHLVAQLNATKEQLADNTSEELPKEVKEQLDVQEEKEVNAFTFTTLPHVLCCGQQQERKLLSSENPLGDFKTVPLRPNHYDYLCDGCDVVKHVMSHVSGNGVTLITTDKKVLLTSPLLTGAISLKLTDIKPKDNHYEFLIYKYLELLKYDVKDLYALLSEDKFNYTTEGNSKNRVTFIDGYEDFVVTTTPTFDGVEYVGEDKHGTEFVLFEEIDDFNMAMRFKHLIKSRMRCFVSGDILLEEEEEEEE